MRYMKTYIYMCRYHCSWRAGDTGTLLSNAKVMLVSLSLSLSLSLSVCVCTDRAGVGKKSITAKERKIAHHASHTPRRPPATATATHHSWCCAKHRKKNGIFTDFGRRPFESDITSKVCQRNQRCRMERERIDHPPHVAFTHWKYSSTTLVVLQVLQIRFFVF